MPKRVDVGKSFYPRLAHRNKNQGDGKHTATEFREQFLSEFDNESFWKDPQPSIILDFSNVKKIGPSFANEAFAFFTKYAPPEKILRVVVIENATTVQYAIIREELESGYKGR